MTIASDGKETLTYTIPVDFGRVYKCVYKLKKGQQGRATFQHSRQCSWPGRTRSTLSLLIHRERLGDSDSSNSLWRPSFCKSNEGLELQLQLQPQPLLSLPSSSSSSPPMPP